MWLMLLAGFVMAYSASISTATGKQPNIMFITMDDMNYDSIASYGCTIPNIAPHIDRLASEGLRFEYAYDQTSSCVPSRNTYQNGRYPHQAGMLSFYNVDANYLILPEILRQHGYFTACVNKPRDTSPTDDYDRYWDCSIIMKEADKRGAPTYSTNVKEALEQARQSKKPFYCVVNIADPHKPFYNDPSGTEKGFDKFAPSIRYETEDVSVPAFLPDVPKIREEMRNYYNSVKRGDDCVGSVLQTLEESGFADSTVIIFISDHGMPLPFAKSSLYPDGVRTPWIIRWPGKVAANQVDSEHMISAIDFLPTVLDIADAPAPSGIMGKSVLPLIQGASDPARDHVFVEFNDNASGIAFPMRAIHTQDFAYIFNAWGSGQNEFKSAATWYQSESTMKRLSKSDPDIAKRYDFLLHRTIEEFYDLRNDPHALINQIDNPVYQEQINDLRNRLRNHLEATNDYTLEAFEVREDVIALQAVYKKMDAAALERAQTYQWKRYRNRNGGTGKNTKLYPVQ